MFTNTLTGYRCSSGTTSKAKEEEPKVCVALTKFELHSFCTFMGPRRSQLMPWTSPFTEKSNQVSGVALLFSWDDQNGARGFTIPSSDFNWAASGDRLADTQSSERSSSGKQVFSHGPPTAPREPFFHNQLVQKLLLRSFVPCFYLFSFLKVL
jgi:hypothetical protein